MKFFASYHRELVSAVVGASLAGILSMATGLYSLTKSFEYAQNKEQLSGLRKDIEFLTRVRNEIDANTQTLVGADYRITLKLGDPVDLFKLMSKLDSKKKEKPSSEEDARSLRMFMGGHQVPILELQAPRERLVVESWGTQFPESGDIPFDLLSEINEYYRRVRRINMSIERMGDLSAGSPISEGFAKVLQRDIEYHNSQVEDLRKLDAVKLKNKVSEQIQTLSARRKKISGAIEPAG